MTNYLSGNALEMLIGSRTSEEAEQAYWKLENTVVVQGQLFQVSEQVVSVLVAALTEPQPPFVRSRILELLFQIVAGESDEAEVAQGLANLGEVCRARAREGLWILYREMFTAHSDAAKEIVEVVELNTQRLEYYSKR